MGYAIGIALSVALAALGMVVAVGLVFSLLEDKEE